jgi:hypothetical protein
MHRILPDGAGCFKSGSSPRGQNKRDIPASLHLKFLSFQPGGVYD